MKQFTAARNYKVLENAISSLTNSTDYGISLAGETVEFRSRNASMSKQLVSVTFGHGVPGLVICDNGKYTLYLVGNQTTLSGEVEVVDVPAHYLTDLFTFPAGKPSWVDGIVTVGWADRFSGFDHDGCPTFNNCGSVVVEYDYHGSIRQNQAFPFGEPVKFGFRLDNNWYDLGDVVDYETSERLPETFDCKCQSPEDFECPCGNNLHCPVDCPYRDQMKIIKGEGWDIWNPVKDDSHDVVRIITKK